MWIRGGWWDGLWIINGLPMAVVCLACLACGIHPEVVVLWMVLTMQTGHVLAPMGLAWSHDGFRQIMLQRRGKYVALPLAILAVGTGVAYGSSLYFPDLHFNPASFSLSGSPTLAEFKNPFMAMFLIYGLWNAYHFGKQAFGVMSIYRHKSARTYGREQRTVDLVYCCGTIWATMFIPLVPQLARAGHDLIGRPGHPHPFLDYTHALYVAAALMAMVVMLWREMRVGFCLPRVLLILTDGLGMIMAFQHGLWGFAMITVNHWLVAIGLASHVWANHRSRSPYLFALGLMAVGMGLFCLLFADFGKLPSAGFVAAALHFTVTAVGLRLALGFVHFLYDRWLWKLSAAQVRETIGKDFISGTKPALTSVNFDATLTENII